MTLPDFTAPPPAPPRRQAGRDALTDQIGRLIRENEALTLANAGLRLALAREHAINDSLADLLSELQRRHALFVRAGGCGGCYR